jgi:hypothetical protein
VSGTKECVACHRTITRRTKGGQYTERAVHWQQRQTCGRKECLKAARGRALLARAPAREHPNGTLRHRVASTSEERETLDELALAILNAAPAPLTVAGVARAALAAGADLGFEDAFGALERLAHSRRVGCVTPENPRVSGIYHPRLPKRKRAAA